MAIIQGDVIGGSAGGFYPKEIEQSLRFNDDDSAYLSWTPASAGNRKTWTWSGWVKRGNIDSTFQLFWANDTGVYSSGIAFDASGIIVVRARGATTSGGGSTTAVYRDPAAWYHVVFSVDTTQATASDRWKLYVNGEQVTSFSSATYPSQNEDTNCNNTVPHLMGATYYNGSYDYTVGEGYLAETHFIDGTAYDATAFGEFKNGVWVAKEFAGTYGTNGFYLPFRNDYTVEGFSATTWTGNGTANTYMGGIGFSPDLIWIKQRSGANVHQITDSVRGPLKALNSNLTATENTYDSVRSFEADGFTMGTSATTNSSGGSYVAWCWDAGTGSPVSNTDGSITSTVKANPSRGFSIVSYTGTGANATVGHGLSSAPEMVIVKRRSSAEDWCVYNSSNGAGGYVLLNTTGAYVADTSMWNNTAPTSSVFNLGVSGGSNGSASTYIAYCFHSVSGYSKMGSYTGTGASGNKITTGFKPAFVLTKMTSSAGEWRIHDSTRSATDPRNDILYANQSAAELVDNPIDFDDDGFTLQHGLAQENGSGSTYIYMAFADTREAAFWLDDSGNNNDWENNGLTESDISLDSPTNNFATLNPLYGTPNYHNLSEGNVKATLTATTTGRLIESTIAVSSGKYYAEYIETYSFSSNAFGIAYTGSDTDSGGVPTGNSCVYLANGAIYLNNSLDSSGNATFNVGDVIGVALDCDANTVKFYKNNTLVKSLSINSDTYAFCGYANQVSDHWIANFGQDSSFAGNKVPQGYTDANGIGDFYYAPPAGYLALCTANLPEPVISPLDDASPSDHFAPVIWTGDNTSPRTISTGFQPDLVWIKIRDTTGNHDLFDSVRGYGVNKDLCTDLTSAEGGSNQSSVSGYVSSTTSDGFVVTAGSSDAGEVNYSGRAYVAWNWKANGSGVSNTDGSITSTVSANVDAGFSIVSYTGTGSAATVGHGLSQAPDMVIVKNRDDGARGWPTYVSALNNSSQYLVLNTTASAGTDAGVFNGTAPTSSVFSLGVDTFANDSGDAHIAYCFHSVEGFSKFSSYTGNGSTDGPFVYTGFRPSFVICKRTDSAEQWAMFDDERDSYNDASIATLRANSSANEFDSTTRATDFLSNGFKLRGADTEVNASGGTYIYMAFAENPFKYSNAR